MSRYFVNTDALREQLEFWSAYDREGVAGYIYCEEEDKNCFIAEQVAHFTALLLNMLEKDNEYSFDNLWEILNEEEIEGVDKLQCPHCNLFFGEEDYIIEDGHCPFCRERMVD